MGTIANILGFGQTNGPHYQLDYSTATGAGITTMSQATLASTNGIANIINPSADGYSVVLRSDVDVDPIAGNGYPRSEWREKATDGTTNRAFNGTTGDHKCEVLVYPMHLPPEKSSFVIVQTHDAVQDVLEVAMQRNSGSGNLEVVGRVAHDGQSGSSSGIPKLITTFDWGMWVHAWIRIGAIAPGSVPGWEFFCNGTFVRSWDTGMPEADFINGNNAYFKSGMYLQTKWTGSGTGGLETDRNEYGEAAWRTFRTYHNGEAAPWIPTVGTPTYDAVSNVRAGAKTSGHQTVPLASGGTGINLTPALPASPTNKTMMLCIVRTSRGIATTTLATSAAPKPDSAPSTPTMASDWVPVIRTRMPVSATAPLVGAYGGGPNLQAHSVRWLLFAKPWVSGDTAPTVAYAPGASLTDTMSAVIVGIDDARITTILADLIDKAPAGLDVSNPNNTTTTEAGITYAAATSTTQLGPTGAITGAAPGSLAIACVYHETNASSGAIAVVAGTDSPALTWAELCEGATATITPATGSTASEDEPAWAVDYAIIPGSAGQNIVAKTATATIAADANKPNTAGAAVPGKGWGVLFTIQPAQQRRRGHRAACTVG